MPLRDVAGWLLENSTFKARYERIAAEAAQSELPDDAVRAELPGEPPDWGYLLLVASILATAEDDAPYAASAHEAALRIAHHCLTRPIPPSAVVPPTSDQVDFEHEATSLESVSPGTDDVPSEAQRAAAATVLDTLANIPAIALAARREYLPANLGTRLPMPVRIEQVRRGIEHSVPLVDNTTLSVNRFQRRFWTVVDANDWVSVSAPTSAGKSFIVTQWIIDFVRRRPRATVVYLVPTRALISQVEFELNSLVRTLQRRDIAVTSMPLPRSIIPDRAHIFVLTQERLHLLQTAVPELRVDVLVVDEAHKLGDGHRGVLLQQVVEAVARGHHGVKVVFASPMTSNPEALVQDAPSNAREAFRSSEVTVNQNLLWVTQQPRMPRQWTVHLCRPENERIKLGELTLGSTPDTQTKRLSYVAHAIAGGRGGTVVYVNRAFDAENVALQLYGLRGPESDIRTHPRIAALIDLCRRTVHDDFALAQVLARGIAFHYGNLPLLIRTEVERLFSDGILHFLVCTSTLIEGVNMSCRNMVVRGPRKGVRQRMSAEDFWNLAGRAGRWGKEFQGNIICVDPTLENVWGPELAPTKRRHYAIRRTTDKVIAAPEALIRFVEAGTPRREANQAPDLEFVFAYLAAHQRRHGTIRSLPWVQRLDAAVVTRVEDVVSAAVADIRTPIEVMERNPGISPIAMDALLRRMDRPMRDPTTLLPVDPASDEAWNVYTQIFTRIGATLNVGLGPTSRRSAQLALLVTRWMRGYSLSRLIKDRIDYLRSRGARTPTSTIIRTVLGEVENIARFEAPRSLACYVDLLRVYLADVDRPDLADQLLDLSLMLEFGVSRQTQVSLIGLGLSRTSAIFLNELLTDDDLTEAAALQWLVEGIWRVAELPALVKLEIERVLALHLPDDPSRLQPTG